MITTPETIVPADPHYSMVIEWSDEDQLYIVSFPEWAAAGYISHTHGATYEKAADPEMQASALAGSRAPCRVRCYANAPCHRCGREVCL